MKIISPAFHGFLDYLTVVLFLFAPTVMVLIGMARTFAYVLAAVHLAMTLVTNFPLGAAKVIPLAIHKWVERVVGPVLIVIPFVLRFDIPGLAFYVGMGVVILLVGLLTDYRQTQ